MNTKLNNFIKGVLGTEFSVRSFFGNLTAENPLLEIDEWKKQESPHLLVAACALPDEETNSLYVWFDNLAYGSHKCVLCRFDLEGFNPKTSLPTDGTIAPVGVTTFIYVNGNIERPSYTVHPEYENAEGVRRILWSKILPADNLRLFNTVVED